MKKIVILVVLTIIITFITTLLLGVYLGNQPPFVLGALIFAGFCFLSLSYLSVHMDKKNKE